MKEFIPKSHIFPKASFVLGSFRAMLWSHSTFLLIPDDVEVQSCFPVYKLVRICVNSSKKPKMSISFTVAFSNICREYFVVFIFSVDSCAYTFLEPSNKSFTNGRNNTNIYKRGQFLIDVK